MTKPINPKNPPPVTSNSRDAVESAIDRTKGHQSADWDDEIQGHEHIPTWDDVTKLKRSAATCQRSSMSHL
jgi:hypothetical protein